MVAIGLPVVGPDDPRPGPPLPRHVFDVRVKRLAAPIDAPDHRIGRPPLVDSRGIEETNERIPTARRGAHNARSTERRFKTEHWNLRGVVGPLAGRADAAPDPGRLARTVCGNI